MGEPTVARDVFFLDDQSEMQEPRFNPIGSLTIYVLVNVVLLLVLYPTFFVLTLTEGGLGAIAIQSVASIIVFGVCWVGGHAMASLEPSTRGIVINAVLAGAVLTVAVVLPVTGAVLVYPKAGAAELAVIPPFATMLSSAVANSAVVLVVVLGLSVAASVRGRREAELQRSAGVPDGEGAQCLACGAFDMALAEEADQVDVCRQCGYEQTKDASQLLTAEDLMALTASRMDPNR